MKIGDPGWRCFDTNEQVLIVAEIGLNHEGHPGVASQMVREAAKAGANAVKFQVYQTDKYADPSDPERYERLRRFQISDSPHTALASLADHARSLGMVFIGTPFDLESADLCNEICDAVKIASKDIDFWPLVERVVSGDKPIILSTGMSDLWRVAAPLNIYRPRSEVALLHCVSGYPVPNWQAQLKGIRALAQAFIGRTVGYSDHTIGLDAAPLAVALGARIIEKHFTLDKNYSDFRDHAVSATPDEFKLMVRRIRRAEELLGEPIKRVMPCEADTIEACKRERAFRVSVLTS